MLVTVGIQSSIWGLTGPVNPLFVLSLGATPALWGAMLSGSGFLMIFAEPTWGWLGDRLGVRRPFVAALLANALGAWLLFLWPGLPMIALAQLSAGLFGPANSVLGRGYLVRAYPHSRQMFGLTLQMVVGSVCNAVGSTIGGLVYQVAGARLVFLLVALLSSISAAVASLPKEPPPFPSAPSADPREPPTHSRALLSEPSAVLGAVAVMQFLGQRLFISFLVILARDRAALSGSAAGLMLATFSVASVLFLLVLNRLNSRLSLLARILIGMCIEAVGAAVCSFSYTFGAFLVGVVVYALGSSLANPARVILVGRLSSPSAYGRALGLHGAFEDIGVAAGPALGGMLWGAVGPSLTYQAAAIALFAGGMIALRLGRFRDATRRDI